MLILENEANVTVQVTTKVKNVSKTTTYSGVVLDRRISSMNGQYDYFVLLSVPNPFNPEQKITSKKWFKGTQVTGREIRKQQEGTK